MGHYKPYKPAQFGGKIQTHIKPFLFVIQETFINLAWINHKLHYVRFLNVFRNICE